MLTPWVKILVGAPESVDHRSFNALGTQLPSATARELAFGVKKRAEGPRALDLRLAKPTKIGN
jgi:hypothetical protein